MLIFQLEPADIVDGNLKLTLGLLQQLANHYPVNSMPQQSLLEKAMLAWFKVNIILTYLPCFYLFITGISPRMQHH